MRVFKIVLLVTVLLVLTATLCYILGSRDLPAVNDADLLLEPVPLLAKTDNAYYFLPKQEDFSEAELELHFDAGMVQRGKSSTSPQQAVENTRVITDAFIVASKKTGYQCPSTINVYEYTAESCPLNRIRDHADLMVLRAEVSLTNGDTTDALESLLAVTRIASMLSSAHSQFLEQLVAVALYRKTFEPLLQITGSLSAAGRAKLINELEIFGPDSSNLGNGLRGEYMSLKTTVPHDDLSATDTVVFKEEYGLNPNNYYLWHRNRTLNDIAEMYRFQIAYVTKECGEGAVELAKLESHVTELTKISFIDYVMPNVVGRMLNSVIAGSLADSKMNFCEQESNYRSISSA